MAKRCTRCAWSCPLRSTSFVPHSWRLFDWRRSLTTASKVTCVIFCCAHVIVFCNVCRPHFQIEPRRRTVTPALTVEDHRHTHKHNNRTTGAIARSCLGWNRDPESGICPVAPLTTPTQHNQVTLDEEHESVVSRSTPPDSMAVPAPSPWTQTRS